MSVNLLIDFVSQVQPHATVHGFETLSRGFTGCLDAVQLWGTPLPLHSSSANAFAALKRLANVQFTCGPPSTPGACGLHPCLNGGSCRDDPSKSGGFTCMCGERFMGPNCERDTAPCASSPCLFGGRCIPLASGSYKCECEEGQTGMCKQTISIATLIGQYLQS